MQEQKILVLIDSNAIIHRSYHALPKTMTTRKGEMTNAVYGFTTTLIKVLEDLKPDYIAASFDLAGPTFRHTEYKEYKGTRIKADQELYDQIPRVKELLEAFNIPIYVKEGFEADDVIGTITDKFELRHSVISNNPSVISTSSEVEKEKSHEISRLDEPMARNDKADEDDNIIRSNYKVYIVTGDKDAFQLVDGNIFVYNLKAGLSQVQIVDRAAIKEDWGLDPEDFIDLKALAGDPSDNIPGVPGIGPKTAIDLLQRFDTLKKLYERIEATSAVISNDSEKSHEISRPDEPMARNDKLIELSAKQLEIKPRILNLLIEYKDQAFLSQRLATIRRDVPLDFDLDKCRWGDYDKEKVREFFAEMQFTSLLKRFGVLPAEPPKTKEAKEQKEKDNQLKLL